MVWTSNQAVLEMAAENTGYEAYCSKSKISSESNPLVFYKHSSTCDSVKGTSSLDSRHAALYLGETLMANSSHNMIHVTELRISIAGALTVNNYKD